MHLAQGLGRPLRHHGANPRLAECPIKAEVDLGNARDRGETLLVVRVIDAEGADVVERSGFETEEILTVDELSVLRLVRDLDDCGFVEPRRHGFDHLHARDELLMLLQGDFSGDENA